MLNTVCTSVVAPTVVFDSSVLPGSYDSWIVLRQCPTVVVHFLSFAADVEVKLKGKKERRGCWERLKSFFRCKDSKEESFRVERKNLCESGGKVKGFFPIIHDGVREDAKRRWE